MVGQRGANRILLHRLDNALLRTQYTTGTSKKEGRILIK
jgi:hypothetical protein